MKRSVFDAIVRAAAMLLVGWYRRRVTIDRPTESSARRDESPPDQPAHVQEEEPADPWARFRGSARWVHDREGHVGRPYWPGGNSGVTLDPGVDLGYSDVFRWDDIERLYADILTHDQFAALFRVRGRRGKSARIALENTPDVQAIRIGRDDAARVFEFAAEAYWRRIAARFPSLLDDQTPPEVQTALLSLAYNRGPDNPDLRRLADPIERHDWPAVASIIAGMQQDHRLVATRERRCLEASLIRSGLTTA